MARVVPLEIEHASGEQRREFEEGLARYGRMTNMKRTLLHSPSAYRALMQWYPLFDEVKRIVGERLAIVFAHAISAESDCLICTTFMRRVLIDWGERPDCLELDDTGRLLVDLGRAIARQGNRLPGALYLRAKALFGVQELVALTGFGALMVATNLVNNVLEVDLDEYLYEYLDPATLRTRAVTGTR